QEIPERAPSEPRAQAQGFADPTAFAPPPRAREGAETANAKSAAISAHIAAARRAANAAAADVERRDEIESARKAGAKASGGLTGLAQDLFTRHRRPMLLGAAGAMTLLTGVAVIEMRGGHAPERKS